MNIRQPSVAARIQASGALDVIRARRGWVRYWIHQKVAEFNKRFYKRGDLLPIPIIKPPEGERTFIEEGAWIADFPSGYRDALISGVQWRRITYRIVNGKTKFCYDDVWTSDLPPGSSELRRLLLVRERDLGPELGMIDKREAAAHAKKLTDENLEDYRRLFNVINGLKREHDHLMDKAISILGALADAEDLDVGLEKFGLPKSPTDILTGSMDRHTPGR